jgi:hypothetical protein
VATFPDALDAALGARFAFPGVKSPASTRRGLTARMNALVKAHGGNARQAAASAGIPDRTWRDWRNGTHPPSTRSLRKLEGAYARQIVAPAVARLLTDKSKAITDIHVRADVIGDPGKSRYRNSVIHRWFRAEKIDTQKVVNAWLHGGGERAAQAYEAEVAKAYGTPFGFEGNNVAIDLFP